MIVKLLTIIIVELLLTISGLLREMKTAVHFN